MTHLVYLLYFLNLIVNCLLVCFIVLDCEFTFSGVLSWDSYEARIEEESLSKVIVLLFLPDAQKAFPGQDHLHVHFIA